MYFTWFHIYAHSMHFKTIELKTELKYKFTNSDRECSSLDLVLRVNFSTFPLFLAVNVYCEFQRLFHSFFTVLFSIYEFLYESSGLADDLICVYLSTIRIFFRNICFSHLIFFRFKWKQEKKWNDDAYSALSCWKFVCSFVAKAFKHHKYCWHLSSTKNEVVARVAIRQKIRNASPSWIEFKEFASIYRFAMVSCFPLIFVVCHVIPQ